MDPTKADLIVVSKDPDGTPNVVVEDGTSHAIWSERYRDEDIGPITFYGVTAVATVTELTLTVTTGPYSDDDWADVTYTWTLPGTTDIYAIGHARRDGRA